MRRAIFPGSFDPFTLGHYSIVLRGLKLFDEIIIGIGINHAKKSLFSVEKKIDIISQAFIDEPKVIVKSYDSLTVDFAKNENAHFILRGIRSVGDFESEHAIAENNHKLSKIETIVLFTEAQHSFISSSIVRDLLYYKKDISQFLPPNVKL